MSSNDDKNRPAGAFTTLAQKALRQAEEYAREAGCAFVGCEHLLLAILKQEGGMPVKYFTSNGIALDSITEALQKQMAKDAEEAPPPPPGEALPVTARMQKILSQAKSEAETLGFSFIGLEHILLALLAEGRSAAARMLNDSGIAYAGFMTWLRQSLDSQYLPDELAQEAPGEGDGTNPPQQPGEPPAHDAAPSGPGESVTAGGPGGFGGRERQSALQAFGRDLTEMARQGKLDPVIGRAREIERAIQILCRRTKNNPVLIGE
ncbi:MAG: ATP-dependent Clp protease ATP-binding subunit, partial [Victivallales bacterium]|nr:ATP-dependent Clp protease ATP-binding subunit [Victivallales bacterium]